MNFVKLFMSLYFLIIVTESRSEPSHKLKAFSSDSLELIKQNTPDKPFILLLWSLDCPPCFKELELIGHTRQQELDEFIIIATDDISKSKEALKVLKGFNIISDNLWIFVTENKEKLRYSIDPLWRGELPRSYLFKNAKLQSFHSGVLTDDKLKIWLSYLHTENHEE